jgi:acetyl esterase
MRPPDSILALTRLLFRLPTPALYALAGGVAKNDRGASLDPQIAAMLAMVEKLGFEKTPELGPERARAQTRDDSALAGPPRVSMAVVEDRFIPGPAGSLRTRLYRPRATGPMPTMVYLHGGGFVIGDLESHDGVCRRIAAASGCAVLAVDYRLAPEHRYPAAVDDAEAAFRWVAEHPDAIGADPARLGIGGDSAGGNLAAVVARRLRDGGGPAPRMQLLIYPVTDMTMSQPSIETFARGYYLERSQMDWFLEQYVPPERIREPDASPLFVDDLSGLSPAIVVTAGFDPLRDEGEAYAERLREAGVSVRARCEAGLIHPFVSLAGISRESSAALDRIGRDVGELLR